LNRHGKYTLQFIGDGGTGTTERNKHLIESGNSNSLAGHIYKHFPKIDLQHCLDHCLDLINKEAEKVMP
jgi:hypothetical protein